MTEEKKEEEESTRKKSQSKTPDKKLVEEKSEDEGEFKIQIIRRYNEDEKRKEADVAIPENKELNENRENNLSQPHENVNDHDDDHQYSKKLSEKDFEDLDQAEIDKIQMQVSDSKQCF